VNVIKENVVPSRFSLRKIRNTAVIGLNRIGILTYNRLKDQVLARENLVGIIDIYGKDINIIINGSLGHVNLLGNIKNFKSIIKKYEIDHIIIAVDPDDISQIHNIVNICRSYNIEYEFASEIQDFIFGKTIKQVFSDLHRPLHPSKRQILDSLLAGILMFLFLPLHIITSLLIKIDSKGPALYSQERVGKNGRIFRVFKFRTMFIDAEKHSGPVLASKDDPRITNIGRILRKTRIDEIPQLLNVIIGDMSFIGPRPERPYFVEKYIRAIPMYRNRLKVKPGITGLAQVVSGYDEDIEDVKIKLQHDLNYVENYNSLRLNFYILFQTVKVVLTAQGQ
jgi:exopolysaccharide biosynthesis polyprenyl glycosylphosphotransferase